MLLYEVSLGKSVDVIVDVIVDVTEANDMIVARSFQLVLGVDNNLSCRHKLRPCSSGML